MDLLQTEIHFAFLKEMIQIRAGGRHPHAETKINFCQPFLQNMIIWYSFHLATSSLITHKPLKQGFNLTLPSSIPSSDQGTDAPTSNVSWADPSEPLWPFHAEAPYLPAATAHELDPALVWELFPWSGKNGWSSNQRGDDMWQHTHGFRLSDCDFAFMILVFYTPGLLSPMRNQTPFV